ncbi:AAA domain protein, partial [Vibrio parahaemolyticus V-223/04]
FHHSTALCRLLNLFSFVVFLAQEKQPWRNNW